mgnify:CR=1 FL=1
MYDDDGNYKTLQGAEFEITIDGEKYLVNGENPITDKQGLIKLSKLGNGEDGYSM